MTSISGFGPIVQAPGKFVSGPTSALQPINPIVMNGIREMQIPRALVVINGQTFLLNKYTITWNAHGILDTAEIDVPNQGNPDWTKLLFLNESDTSAVPVVIKVGYPSTAGPVSPQSLSNRFYGQLDNYKIQHAKGITTFQVRSLGAILADKRLTTPVVYTTSKQLVESQVKAAGLNSVILVNGTGVQLAEVFRRQFVAGIKNIRVWDLITQCSLYDDADVWVDGNTLYYVQPYLLDPQRQLVTLNVGTDLEELEVTHAEQYNRKIRVEVRTWEPTTITGSAVRITTLADGSVQKAQVTRQSTSTPVFGTAGISYTNYSYNSQTGEYTQTQGTRSKIGGSFQTSNAPLSDSGLEIYKFFEPGMSPTEVNNYCMYQWRRISMHEFAATLTLPMRQEMFKVFNRSMLLRVTGSPYSLVNSKYWPRRITESVDLEAGAKWLVEAVNHQLPLGEGTQ